MVTLETSSKWSHLVFPRKVFVKILALEVDGRRSSRERERGRGEEERPRKRQTKKHKSTHNIKK